MTLRSRLMIGLIALSSFPLISSGADVATTATPRIYNQVEIAYIQGLNCDTFTEAAAKTRCLEIKKQVAMQAPVTGTGVSLPPPVKSESGSMDQHPPIPPRSQTGSDDHRPMMNSGSTTLPKPPKPPMGSGAEMNNPGQGLMFAIGQLSLADREILVKMIREYLTKKGIDLSKYAEKREEIKEVKKEARTEIKEIRNTTQDAARAKREEMRKKVMEIKNGSGATR